MLRARSQLFITAFAGLIGCIDSQSSRADAAADFYTGKRLTLVMGTSSGGTYDTYGRLLARHIVNHIPGKPGVVVQNKPGAGSITAINFVYNVAPQDGTILLMLNRAAAFSQILGQDGPQFEAKKLNWIGSLDKETAVIYLKSDAPVRTFEEARKIPLLIGGTSPRAGNVMFPALLNNSLGTKFKIIHGYKSLNDQFLALERGEVQGIESTLSSMLNEFPDWPQKLNVILQLGVSRDHAVPDVPTVMEFIKPDFITGGHTIEEVKGFWALMVDPNEIARPFAMGPQVPGERVKVIRDAFKAMLTDPAFLDEAKRGRMDINPLQGDQIQELIEKAAATPKSIVEKLNQEVIYREPK